MRLAILTPSLNLENGGGSNYSLYLTASELARLGHQVELLVWSGSAAPVPADLPFRVRYLPQRPGPRWASAQALRRVLTRLEESFDLFHLYNPSFVFGGGLYRARGGRRPVVATLNNYQVICTNVDQMTEACHRSCDLFKRIAHTPGRPGRKLISLPTRFWEAGEGFRLFRRIDRLLPDSDLLKSLYAEAGLDMTRATVVPEVIDHAAFAAHRPSSAERLAPRPDGRWHLLYAGRLVYSKGVDLLIGSLRQLPAEVHLHVAGQGPAEPTLRARVAGLGLRDRVTFHGWVPNEDIWQLYRQAHLFVHPGRWPEPFGRTVLEAMVLGLPTIVSNTGHPPALVGDDGLIFEPGSVAGLVAAIQSALARYPERVAIAERATERTTEFDRARVTRRLVRIYEQVLAISRLPLARPLGLNHRPIGSGLH